MSYFYTNLGTPSFMTPNRKNATLTTNGILPSGIFQHGIPLPMSALSTSDPSISLTVVQDSSFVKQHFQFDALLDGMSFDSGSTVLSRFGEASLADFLELLVDMSEVTSVSITAHTDSQGTDRENQILSEKRANVVKRYIKNSFSRSNCVQQWNG